MMMTTTTINHFTYSWRFCSSLNSWQIYRIFRVVLIHCIITNPQCTWFAICIFSFIQTKSHQSVIKLDIHDSMPLNMSWILIQFVINKMWSYHYIDVIMASQITSVSIVYSIVCSDADQRKHQSSASLAFVLGIHRYRWIPRTKGQLRGKSFHLMTSSWCCPVVIGKHTIANWSVI